MESSNNYNENPKKDMIKTHKKSQSINLVMSNNFVNSEKI